MVLNGKPDRSCSQRQREDVLKGSDQYFQIISLLLKSFSGYFLWEKDPSPVLWHLGLSFCSCTMPQDLCTAWTGLVLPAFCLVSATLASQLLSLSGSLRERGAGKVPLLDVP